MPRWTPWLLATALLVSSQSLALPQPAQAADTLDSLLEEVKIPVMAPNLRTALDFLVARTSPEQGLSTVTAYATWKALSENQPVSFSFPGGPTNEFIVLTAQKIDDLLIVQKNLLAQEARDRYRPDFTAFKQILAARLPGIRTQIQTEQTQSRSEISRLDTLSTQLATRLSSLGAAITQLNLQSQNTLLRLQQAQLVYNQTYQSWSQIQGDYNSVVNALSLLTSDHDRERTHWNQLQQQLKQQQELARREEELIFKDAANAALHRQRAEYHHAQIRQIQQQLAVSGNRLRDLNGRIDQTRYRLSQVQQHLQDWKRRLDGDALPVNQAKSELESLQKQLSEHQASVTSTQTEATHTQGQLNRLTGLLPHYTSGEAGLTTLQQACSSLKDHTGYNSQKPVLLSHFTQAAQLAAHADYQLLHGSRLSEQLRPLLSLFRNMDKPALP